MTAYRHGSPGLGKALAALQMLAPEASGPSPTLPELTDRLSHLKGTQDEWREAVAYLAAQVHAERRISDAAAARDAAFALSQIRAQVARFDELHPEATS